jgi:hypothetical protein
MRAVIDHTNREMRLFAQSPVAGRVGFVPKYRMLKTFLLLAAISLQTPASTKPELGIVAGSISPPGESKVVLLSPQYATLWVSDVQKRLDTYWERYKPAFAQRKEFFFEVSTMAHRDALDYIVSRMQRDGRIDVSNFIHTTNSDGKFEFKDVPLGEYKIVAISKVGAEETLWQESVDVTGSVPQFVRLKKIVP